MSIKKSASVSASMAVTAPIRSEYDYHTAEYDLTKTEWYVIYRAAGHPLP